MRRALSMIIMALLAIVVIPLAMIAELMSWLFRLKEKRTAGEVADDLRQSIESRGAKWDWDEFTSVPIEDPQLEDLRRRAAAVYLPLTQEGSVILRNLLAEAEGLEQTQAGTLDKHANAFIAEEPGPPTRRFWIYADPWIGSIDGWYFACAELSPDGEWLFVGETYEAYFFQVMRYPSLHSRGTLEWRRESDGQVVDLAELQGMLDGIQATASDLPADLGLPELGRPGPSRRVMMPLLGSDEQAWTIAHAFPTGTGTFLVGGPEPEDENWAYPPGSWVRCGPDESDAEQLRILGLTADPSRANIEEDEEELGKRMSCLVAMFVGMPIGGAVWFLFFYKGCGDVVRCEESEVVRAVIAVATIALFATLAGWIARLVVNQRSRRSVDGGAQSREN